MPLNDGEIFAGFRIIRLLGSGGMGEVYLAQHPRLPRRDALKVLPADVSADPEYRTRFNREADLASTLYHPHIVGVHDRGEYDGQLWISMDFVDGQDAARLLADRYPAGMPVEQVVRIVTAVASALDYAHKQGLLHRDVKPANIMLTHLDDDGEQRILLADFGIARNVDDISGLTTTNMTVGTVAYSAPEQLMGEEIDGRADEYALAATAYHLLTGSQLFPHSNPAVVISRHLNTQPPTLAESRPELADLDPVLAIALAKHPESRFSRCTDFARAFAEQIRPTGDAPASAALTRFAPVPRDATAPAASPPRKGNIESAKRSRSWAITAAVIAVLAVVSGLMLTWRPWKDRSSSAAESAQLPTSVASVRQPPSAKTTTVEPPPPPSFSPTAIDQVLLTDDQLSKGLGVDVTEDPSGGGFGLALESSSYGTSDHAGQVSPSSCVGVAFTGEHEVYGGIDSAKVKTQTFRQIYSSGGSGPTFLFQTAVVFPSAEEAQAFLNTSQAQWDACANGEVDVTLGYENWRGFTLGSVERDENMITVAMASHDPLYGPDACQQALGVRENVVVEARTCEVPNVSGPPGKGDPDWAVPDAERVARAMLSNVTI